MGFKTYKAVVAKLVEEYKNEYYGFEDVQTGIMQFGYGLILGEGALARRGHLFQGGCE